MRARARPHVISFLELKSFFFVGKINVKNRGLSHRWYVWFAIPFSRGEYAIADGNTERKRRDLFISSPRGNS